MDIIQPEKLELPIIVTENKFHGWITQFWADAILTETKLADGLDNHNKSHKVEHGYANVSFLNNHYQSSSNDGYISNGLAKNQLFMS